MIVMVAIASGSAMTIANSILLVQQVAERAMAIQNIVPPRLVRAAFAAGGQNQLI